MSRLRFTNAAIDDLEHIALFIATDNPTAAINLVDAVQEKAGLIATQPQAGRPRPELGENVRSIHVKSYLLIYRPIDDGVELLRILHGARNLDSLFKTPTHPED